MIGRSLYAVAKLRARVAAEADHETGRDFEADFVTFLHHRGH